MRQASTSRYWTPAQDALLARLVLHRLPAERIAVVLRSGATKIAVEVRKSRLGLRAERPGKPS